MKLLPVKALYFSLVIGSFTYAEATHAQTPQLDAPEYSAFYVFGDSLSDNGNLNAVLPGSTYGDRFSNGPVAVEYAAQGINQPLIPANYLAGAFSGTNYAVGGARALDDPEGSATENSINLTTQVNAFLQFQGVLSGNPLDPNALYFVGIGGNDIRDAREDIQNSILASSRTFRARLKAYSQVNKAAQTALTEIEKLALSGAKHIVVMNAPDIGATPEADLVAQQTLAAVEGHFQQRQARYLPQTATNLTRFYNSQLSLGLQKLRLQFPDVEIKEFDLFALEKRITATPQQFQLSEIDTACNLVFSTGILDNFVCDGFLYFDEIHPTTFGHSYIGQGLLDTINSDR